MVTGLFFVPGQYCGLSYCVLRPHSRSAVTQAYVARDVRTRKSVHLTCSRFEHRRGGPPSVEAFLAESAAVRLKAIHGAPTVRDAGVSGDIYWVVRDHVDDAITITDFLGGAPGTSNTLREIRENLQRYPAIMRMSLAIAIGCEIADTLEQGAVHGVVHGALEPRTAIALRPDGTPLVFDIGYAKIFGQPPSSGGSNVPDFRAPEQVAGEEPDVRCDIYALGAILHWLAVGTLSSIGTLPPQLAALFGEAGEAFSALILRAVEPDPRKRLQSWVPFLHTLTGVRNSLQAAGERRSKECSSRSKVPQSGTREVLSSKEPDTEPGAPPSCVVDAVEPAPATRASSLIVEAALTPRVPEAPSWHRDQAPVGQVTTPPIVSLVVPGPVPSNKVPGAEVPTPADKVDIDAVMDTDIELRRDVTPSLPRVQTSTSSDVAAPPSSVTVARPRVASRSRRLRWIALGGTLMLGFGGLSSAVLLPDRRVMDARPSLRNIPTLIVMPAIVANEPPPSPSKASITPRNTRKQKRPVEPRTASDGESVHWRRGCVGWADCESTTYERETYAEIR